MQAVEVMQQNGMVTVMAKLLAKMGFLTLSKIVLSNFGHYPVNMKMA